MQLTLSDFGFQDHGAGKSLVQPANVAQKPADHQASLQVDA